MKILISGYVPAEGRFSMVQTARALHRNLLPILDPEDVAVLDESPGSLIAASHDYSSLGVKIRKRLLSPARLWTRRYDLLHLIDNDYALGIPPWKRAQTVITCHDMHPFLLFERLEDAFSGRLGYRFYARALKTMSRCARIVCVSEFTRQAVLEYTDCRPEQLHVIHQAVEDAFRPINADSAEISEFRRRHELSNKRTILHVGSCAAYKNIEMLLRIFKTLLDATGGELVLLKVGGAFSPEHEELIRKLGLAAKIRHLTGLSEVDMVRAYNASDLLLWPSRYEGFGLPVIEAMACGIPVVCSNGGSLAEVAADAADVYDAMDETGMKEACLRILEDPRRAAGLRQAGLAHAASFTWQRVAREYYRIYREVYGGNR